MRNFNEKTKSRRFWFLGLALLAAVLLWLRFQFRALEKIPAEKRLEVWDGQNFFQSVSSAQTVGDFLSQEKIVLRPEDLVYPGAESPLRFGQKIKIVRPQTVNIKADGQEKEYKIFSSNVLGALAEAGIALAPLDKIQPTAFEPVTEGIKISVTRIEVEEKEVEEEIPFETLEKEDSDLAWRKKEVRQAGENGIKKVKYEITYKNGKEIGREKIFQITEKKPITEIVAVGTKIKVGQTKTGVASWYAHTGTMACASRMFPRGTWLRVTNRENGKQIFVVVNDYGPMRGTGKMLDLDKVAFEKLASLNQGVINVKVEEIVD